MPRFGAPSKITRRTALGLIPSALLGAATVTKQRTQPLPQVGEFVRFPDPSTETPVVRLTTPAYRNLLPASGNRFILLKPRLLYCSSDRAAGQMAPFQIDLRAGTVKQIAETTHLDPLSLSLDRSGRYLYFLDGSTVCRIPTNSRHELRKPEVVAEEASSYDVGSSDSELFIIRQGKLQKSGDRDSRPLAQDVTGRLLVRPGGGGVLFIRSLSVDGTEQELWYAPAPEGGGRAVVLAKGRVHSPCWSENGESLLFLRDVPKNEVFVSEVREVAPETLAERCVSPTSQFATFAPNLNDSMLVGASKSKAQPYIILLLRSLQRELPLCEHRASSAIEVRPCFSPDSRRVYFESDREGKPAIYSVNVELLVEPT